MGLPCIDDTCTNTVTKNPTTRHLEIHTKLHPAGALYEHPSCDGIAVQIIGEPDVRAAVDQGLVQLGITPGGELWAAIARAHTVNFGGGLENASHQITAARIKHDGTESLTNNAANTNPITTNDATNPYDTPALAIVAGTFRLGWTVNTVADAGACIPNKHYIDNPADPGAILYVPYKAKIRAQILAKLGAEPADWTTDPGVGAQRTAFFDIGGTARNDKTPQQLRDWRDFVFPIIIPAHETIHLAVSASHDGDPTIRTFVDTEDFGGSAPVFLDRGIRASGDVIFLPLNATAS